MGLLDSLFGNADQTQALGLLGAHMMQGNAAGGFQAASGLLADAPKRRMQQQLIEAQIAEKLAEAEERKQVAAKRQSDMQEAARVRGLVRNFGKPRPGMGATDQVNGALPPDMRIGAQPQMAGAANNDYQSLVRDGVPLDLVKALAESQNFGRPKATRQMEVDDGKGGKRIALVDDFGQEVAGFAGYTPPVQVNRGDRVDFVKPAPGLSLGMNMSPEGRDASARGWASVNQGAQRLALDAANGAAGKAPAGYRFTPNGQLEFIPGGPADPARNGEKVPSEGERKAATLLQRLEGSSAQLAATLKTAPGAAKPELKAEALRKLPWIGGDTPANIVTSEPRQQVESAQLDMLDAALTLGTGAAYTREQLEGYRKSYFPQIGDDPKAVADKQARLENIIKAARIAAGRAGGQVGGGGASGGSGIKEIK